MSFYVISNCAYIWMCDLVSMYSATELIRYRVIRKISPGLYFSKDLLEGLIFGEGLYTGVYYRRLFASVEVCGIATHTFF